MPPLTWGYLKEWAAANGVQDDYPVTDADLRPVTDVAADHGEGEQGFVLDFDEED